MSRPSSKGSTKPDETTDPADFIHYMKEIQKPEIVEVGKLHKLRILLRNETVAWVESFISGGGMDELVSLLYRILKVEWRLVPLLLVIYPAYANLSLSERNTKTNFSTRSYSV